MGRYHHRSLLTGEETKAHSLSKQAKTAQSLQAFATLQKEAAGLPFPPLSDLPRSLCGILFIHLDFNIPLDFVFLALIPHCTPSFRSVYRLMSPYPGCPIATSNSRGPQLNSLTQSPLSSCFPGQLEWSILLTQ